MEPYQNSRNHWHKNWEKWLHPPTIELIDEVINSFEVSYYRFEKYFGIPKGTIKKVRTGERKLPVFYWHLFYEPPEKPQYVVRKFKEQDATYEPPPQLKKRRKKATRKKKIKVVGRLADLI